MPVTRPFNLHKWIDENRHLLKPPVGNQTMYQNTGDFIVMVVGGPNSRKDFHYNESEELFYQIEGDVSVRIQEDGKIVEIPINQGEIFTAGKDATLSTKRRKYGGAGYREGESGRRN